MKFETTKEKLALIGMIAGIAGLTCCCCFPPVTASATICSAIAIKDLPAGTPHKILAMVGLICGSIGLLLFLLYILLYILSFFLPVLAFPIFAAPFAYLSSLRH